MHARGSFVGRLVVLSSVVGALGVGGAALANDPPARPVITEPQIGRVVNAADVHMECEPFSDPNPGDTHLCSDWEIWTVSPQQRVWLTSCIGGVERLHTHLGDGTFQGSHAGRRELLPDTQYLLRCRHRDSSGDPATEWSPFGDRLFTTGPATRIFPLEADDLVESPAPVWVTVAGAAVDLPHALTPPSLKLESGLGEPMMELLGTTLPGNLVVDSPALAGHTAVRVRVSAGSLAGPLALPETNLTVTMHDGSAHTVYLPSMSVAPGADAFFWVSDAGSTYTGNAGQSTPDFTTLARGNPVPWSVRQAGYRVEVIAGGFQLPVNIAFVPAPGNAPNSPLFYVTELYGQIKVVTRDGTVRDYATGLLNFNPTGNFPGSGEQGVAGVVVDPVNGDVYATMLYSSVPGQEAVPHYPKVVRFTSLDGGLTAATQTTILNMSGETQGQSHQISNITFGPDGKLYVHMGDGFDAARSQDLASFRGKILRVNRDGSAPSDNPLYNAADGISARDYIFAYGVRNPFGGCWRAADGFQYEVENGPSVDRLARIVRGRNYGYTGSDASMATFAAYNWNPATGPVNIAFVDPQTFGGSGFPAAKMGHAFVSESGGTWATGPQSIGKKITEFTFDAAGNVTSGPTPLIDYAGSGKATVVALASGPDGLYFSDLYKDQDYASPIDRGANILRVRFVGDADFSADVTRGGAPLVVRFTDASTVPGITARLWEFGDGATSTEVSPTHTYTDEGSYTVRLTVTGSTGAAVAERPAFIRVGSVARIALIGGGPAAAPLGSDGAIAEHLSDLGYEVTLYDDDPANRPTAAQIGAANDLILVSSTITSANVGGDFRGVPVPMVFWENALLRSGRESLTDNGAVVSATTINVLDNTHPVTRGLAAGPVVAYQSAANTSVSRGVLGAGVRVLATVNGSTDGAVLVAEAGAAAAAGYTTPARRAYLFLEDATWGATTAAARQLLDNAVCWTLGRGAPAFDEQPQDARACTGDDVTLTAHAAGGVAYQWQHDGQPIAGATARTLVLTAVSAEEAGSYAVLASTACGSTLSAEASVTVLAPGACCVADFNGDGFVDFFDYDDFVHCFETGVCPPGRTADANGDGFVDFFDYDTYVGAFETGC